MPYQPAPAEMPPIERVFETLAKIVSWTGAAWLLTGVTRLSLIWIVLGDGTVGRVIGTNWRRP